MEQCFERFDRLRGVDETVDLEVPANAEIVIEGYVNLDELRTEGPFGDHTGFYSLEDEYPVLHVTCITHRKDPVYATTIVGISVPRFGVLIAIQMVTTIGSKVNRPASR